MKEDAYYGLGRDARKSKCLLTFSLHSFVYYFFLMIAVFYQIFFTTSLEELDSECQCRELAVRHLSVLGLNNFGLEFILVFFFNTEMTSW